MLYRIAAAQTLAPGTASAQVTMTTEAGYLCAASVRELLQPPIIALHTPSELFASIWLSNIDTPVQSPLFLLCQGYFGGDQSLSWTGRLLLNPSDYILCRASAGSNIAIQLSIGVE